MGSLAAKQWPNLAIMPVTFFLFLAAIALFGGASSIAEPAQIWARCAAVLFLIRALFMPDVDLGRVRVALLFLSALAAIIAIQLVPLPPRIWLHLPGRAFYGAAAEAAGIPQPWRPISLAPDLTLNSLLALLPPAAALIGIAATPRDSNRAILAALIGIALLSAFVGVLQLGGGDDSPFYLYREVNRGSTTGLFANRNHHAVLLAGSLPMLALWQRDSLRHRPQVARRWASAGATALGIMMLPFILLTGSRAGMLLALIAILLAYALAWSDRPKEREDSRIHRLARIAPPVAAILMAALCLVLARAPAVQRLAHLDVHEEERLTVFEPILAETKAYMPTGAGFGSFDRVYRRQESDSSLSRTYLNHAHDDLLELALEAGVAGLALLLGFISWLAWRAFAVWPARRDPGPDILFARLGSIIVLVLLLASLADYPLRTPLMSVIFAIACGWLGPAGRDPGAGPRPLTRFSARTD